MKGALAAGVGLVFLAAACNTVATGPDGGDAGCGSGCPVGETCIRDRCHPKVCENATQCPSGQSCVAHACTDLTCSPQCPQGQSCQANACIALAAPGCASSGDCPAGDDCVGGYCTETGCQPPCPTGQVCLDGLCVPPDGDTACARPYQQCPSNLGPYCANLERDSANCGICGNGCGSGQICNGAGACAVTCIAGEETCPSSGSYPEVCADPETDDANCGACGTACSGGEACSAGACAATCASGYTSCASSGTPYCADLSSDPANCGSCGQACPGGAGCLQGVCGSPCPPPFLNCSTDGGAACTDVVWDPLNCGKCGAACPKGISCQSGQCQLPGDAGRHPPDAGPRRDAGAPPSCPPCSGSGCTTMLAAGGDTALPQSPNGLALAGNRIYVSDLGPESLDVIDLSTGGVALLAGNWDAGLVNGPPGVAEFSSPAGLAVDGAGNIVVADQANDCVRRVDPAGNVTTLAGSGIAGWVDGAPSQAEFNGPTAVALGPGGMVYVADSSNNVVRAIWPDGGTTTLAGNGVSGFADGPAATAQFNGPAGIAVDDGGNVYVSDSYNDVIRLISSGRVTTVAGGGDAGAIDGPALQTAFASPSAIAFDSSGALYILDFGDGLIRKLAGGNVTTVLGSGDAGCATGPAAQVQLAFPTAVVLDAAGTLYVADGILGVLAVSP